MVFYDCFYFCLSYLRNFRNGKKIVEKNLGPYTGKFIPNEEPISEVENRGGLRNAGVSLLLFVALMAFLMFPSNAIFKIFEEAAGKLTLKEFMNNGLMLMILLLFLIPGYVYGKTVGKINNSNDLVTSMTEAMKSMGGYLVLAFFLHLNL